MLIRKAFRYRIYPNKGQQHKLNVQFGHSRYVYNHYKDKRDTHYEETSETLTYTDCANDLVKLKRDPEHVWLQEADSQALQQKLKDLDKAYVNFFRMCQDGTLPKQDGKPRKDGKPKGYPRFKSKRDKQSIRYPQRFKVEGNKTYLPKVGWVRTVYHRPLEGEMRNCTVTKTKSGQYYISIQCELGIDDPEPRNGEVGIDLGLKTFATLSDGTTIEYPKYLRRAERRLKIRQRRLSRKQRGSKSREKQRLRVARQHERVADQRRDFHHKESRKLVDEHGFIGVETLNIRGMLRNHSLAKSIADSGWGQFIRFCKYKAEWSGGIVSGIDTFFPSSKLCSSCSEKNDMLKLSDREWVCLGCGTLHDRDENAATNILNEAKLNSVEPTTVGATESHAGGGMIPIGGSAPEAQVL